MLTSTMEEANRLDSFNINHYVHLIEIKKAKLIYEKNK